jgi:hypothetical protein
MNAAFYQKIILSNFIARCALRVVVTSLEQHPDGLAPSRNPAAYSGIRI